MYRARQAALGKCRGCRLKALPGSPFCHRHRLAQLGYQRDHLAQNLKRRRDARRRFGGYGARMFNGVSFDDHEAYVDQRRKCAMDYKRGVLAPQLAVRYNTTEGTVLACCREHGVRVHRAGRRRGWSPDTLPVYQC